MKAQYIIQEEALCEVLLKIREEPYIQSVNHLYKQANNLLVNLDMIIQGYNVSSTKRPEKAKKEKAKIVYWKAATRQRRRSELLKNAVLASDIRFNNKMIPRSNNHDMP